MSYENRFQRLRAAFVYFLKLAQNHFLQSNSAVNYSDRRASRRTPSYTGPTVSSGRSRTCRSNRVAVSSSSAPSEGRWRPPVFDRCTRIVHRNASPLSHGSENGFGIHCWWCRGLDGARRAARECMPAGAESLGMILKNKRVST